MDSLPAELPGKPINSNQINTSCDFTWLCTQITLSLHGSGIQEFAKGSLIWDCRLKMDCFSQWMGLNDFACLFKRGLQILQCNFSAVFYFSSFTLHTFTLHTNIPYVTHAINYGLQSKGWKENLSAVNFEGHGFAFIIPGKLDSSLSLPWSLRNKEITLHSS